jgi:uncharacterized BrkB/YihY/UPF0761 family membrane protein
MLWFYFTGVAILIGGEVNCEFAETCSDVDKIAEVESVSS